MRHRYYNMDQVVGQALATYRRHVEQVGRAQVVDTSHLAAASSLAAE